MECIHFPSMFDFFHLMLTINYSDIPRWYIKGYTSRAYHNPITFPPVLYYNMRNPQDSILAG